MMRKRSWLYHVTACLAFSIPYITRLAYALYLPCPVVSGEAVVREEKLTIYHYHWVQPAARIGFFDRIWYE